MRLPSLRSGAPAAVLAVMLATAACTTPAKRIERTLIEEGVPPAMARCLGERLDARLSTAELRTLGRAAAKLSQTDWRGLTVGQALLLARELNDPALLAAVTGAGFDCLALR
jgi:hypothetical protein